MNNPFEEFDNWDEAMPENDIFNVASQQSTTLPRLTTTNTQIRQIGHVLGRHYPASVINRNIHRNKIRVEANLERIDEMMARGTERDIQFAEILTKRADKYANRLERWVRIAENKRRERDTGVTRINFPS